MKTYAKRGSAYWPFERWPEQDREMWLQNCAEGDPFDEVTHGARIRAPTREFYSKGYGAWLCFLDRRNWLDPAVPPLGRVSRPRLRAYLRALQDEGYAASTIAARFTGLAYSIRILTPGSEVSWIERPYGIKVSAMLQKQQRPLMVPDSNVLFRWAIEMMDTATSASIYQDGLLLAFLASRGRRLRSMALLRVGHELVEAPNGFRIELTPDQVKTNRSDRFDLPRELTCYIRRYLAELRPVLMGLQRHDALWVNSRGAPWTREGVKARIRKLTGQRFGTSFGPHRFRHALATTAALRQPASPGLAAGVLGITGQVIEQHYDRANGIQAMNHYDAAVRARLRRLRGS